MDNLFTLCIGLDGWYGIDYSCAVLMDIVLINCKQTGGIVLSKDAVIL